MTRDHRSPAAILDALDRAGDAPTHADKAAIHPADARGAAALIRRLLAKEDPETYPSDIFERSA